MTRDDLKRFRALDIDFSDIDLTLQDDFYGIIVPVGAECIGYVEDDDCYFILLPEDERVFRATHAVDETQIHPVASDFKEFLSFVLYCGSVDPMVEIWQWGEDSFRSDMKYRQEDKELAARSKGALEIIAKAFDIAPAYPYKRVEALIEAFDSSELNWPDEYYDVLGLERP